MNSISNTGLANLGLPPVNLTGFVPSVTLVNTWGTNIVFTDASAWPSGDSFKKINISVNDEDGGTAKGAITSGTGTVTIVTSGLKQTGVYKIKATVVSTLGAIADGVVDITSANATGAEGNYSISFTTAN